MSAFSDKALTLFHGKKHPGLGIIIIAALLVELISIVQYRRLHAWAEDDLEKRSVTELQVKAEIIRNTLASAEETMQEHLWDIENHLDEADSMFAVTARLIRANPHIVGGCIAFIPDYYPGKGTFFETYARKADGTIVLEQIGALDHDYTQNPAFRQALETRRPVWSDPYHYGSDPEMWLSTYSYPVADRAGKIAAVCGLDIDLTWLSDTLNAHHSYPSSFALLLTRDGQLIAGPADAHAPEADVAQAVSLLQDSTIVRTGDHAGRLPERFRSARKGQKAYIYSTSLENDPLWQVAQVCYHNEVYAPMRKLRLRQMFLILAGLLILFFMIERFARNETKLRDAHVQQARIGSELSVARNIQKQMLPKSFPLFPDRKDLDIYGSLVPAREVGGDLYDAFIRDNQLFFCIGDVSGKGVPSAMLMAVMHSLFRMVSARENRPEKIVKVLNEELCKDNETNMFVTFFLGVLDLSDGTLSYCNAGHDRPIVVADSVEELPALANLPLGVFDDTAFEGQTCRLDAGTTLFLYTDGLTEAKDVHRQQFSRKKVKETLEQCRMVPGMDAQTMIEALGDAVHRFAGGSELSDDLTMLAVHFKQRAIIKENNI